MDLQELFFPVLQQPCSSFTAVLGVRLSLQQADSKRSVHRQLISRSVAATCSEPLPGCLPGFYQSRLAAQGKGQYLAVLQHLGLTKRKKVVEVPNTFEYRATARKIQHLLKIETRQQYEERLAAEAAARTGRPPLHISHPGFGPEPSTGGSTPA